jgi:hypothetical protein
MTNKRPQKGKVRNAKVATDRATMDVRRRKTRTGQFAKLRGRATVTMTTEEILAFTRDI